jgi:cytochrome c oxidase subunit 3
MNTRPTIDVSRLPASRYDARSPAWWGNTLFMMIETSTVGLMVASYIYLWRNFPEGSWPPPRTESPPQLHPYPDLLYGTINIALLLASCALMRWVELACHKQHNDLERLNVAEPDEAPAESRPPKRPPVILWGTLGMVLIGVVVLVLRWYEFPALKFRWNENAYAGLVWTLLGLHLIYVVIEVVEFVILFGWAAAYGVDENMAGDVVLSGYYWYWTVGAGAVVYFIVYIFPRIA